MLMSGCSSNTLHPAANYAEQVGKPVDKIVEGRFKVYPIYELNDKGENILTESSLVEYYIPHGPAFHAFIDNEEFPEKSLEEIEYILLKGKTYFVPEKSSDGILAKYNQKNRKIIAEVPNKLVEGNFRAVYSKKNGEDGTDAVFTHVWDSPAAYIKGDIYKFLAEWKNNQYIPRGTP